MMVAMGSSNAWILKGVEVISLDEELAGQG